GGGRAALPSWNGLKLVSSPYFSKVLSSAATTNGTNKASMPVAVGTFFSAAGAPRAAAMPTTYRPGPNDRPNARRVSPCEGLPCESLPGECLLRSIVSPFRLREFSKCTLAGGVFTTARRCGRSPSAAHLLGSGSSRIDRDAGRLCYARPLPSDRLRFRPNLGWPKQKQSSAQATRRAGGEHAEIEHLESSLRSRA